MDFKMSIAADSAQNKAGHLRCPFCDSTDNELFSLFGQTLLGTQYYCRNCRTVFEAVRWEESEQEEPLTEDDRS